ncbi:hypothetical protein LCGC14_0373080 [marine sediment metagenome]|uniref:Uncharacterized protein n=1 Tax=marine sediment metagenome TaxID=412755 RepID=A0A0F9WD15_9ZZZZ
MQPKPKGTPPRWQMWTVPHSGTRYVRDSFVNAGYSITHGYAIRGNRDLLSAHFGHLFESTYPMYSEWYPGLSAFVVTRDPLAVLGTHWQRLGDGETPPPPPLSNDLGKFAQIQNGFIAENNPHIHKVEDPIERLGEWAGIDLRPGSDRHSDRRRGDHRRIGRNVIREAIQARDADAICSLISVECWDWFTTSYSALIAPLYRDRLGYDFWWYDE